MSAPLTRAELEARIASGLAGVDERTRQHWDRIAIEPEKWDCSPWGDDGGGFWVVAVDGDQVLWYNEIEEGFATSPFSVRGVIGEYRCNQDDFELFLRTHVELNRHGEVWQQRVPALVPDELRGPGLIRRRQTTYWELAPIAGGHYRVHFREKAEHAFATPHYPALDISDRHPLLRDYDEGWRSLFISEAAGRGDLIEELERLIRATSDGWRTLEDYAPTTAARTVLDTGDGLLFRAPQSMATAAARLLRDAGIDVSLLVDAAPRPGMRVLTLERSYVIARELRFERLR